MEIFEDKSWKSCSIITSIAGFGGGLDIYDREVFDIDFLCYGLLVGSIDGDTTYMDINHIIAIKTVPYSKDEMLKRIVTPFKDGVL